MAGSAARRTPPRHTTSQRVTGRRIAPAAALFALAMPAQALAAGPALGTAFGPLAIVGLLLIGGGLLFLFGPDLLRRSGASRAVEAPEEARTLHYRGADMNVSGDTRPANERLVVEESRSAPKPESTPKRAAKSRPAAKPAGAKSASAPTKTDDAPLGVVYTAEVCSEYAGGLSDQVLGRANVFFSSLAEEGEIDSSLLAERLDALPTELAGLLLTPLTRRAEAITTPPPFAIGRVKGTRRRLWLDEDGVAGRMAAAIGREVGARNGSGTTKKNGSGKPAARKAVADELASMRATGS